MSACFRLLVRRPTEGDSVEVDIRGEDTVHALCQRAAAAFGQLGRPRICFRGVLLAGNATLKSAGITPAHFVVVCFSRVPALSRICGGHGWVVHGLVLEFSDGVRTGFFAENDGSPLPISDDAALARRGGVWHEVARGERLMSVTGHHSTMGYLCGAIELRLSSGRSISFKGDNPNVFGARFVHAAPDPPSGYLELSFDDGRCMCLRARVEPPAPAAAPGAPPREGTPPRVLNSVKELLAWRPPLTGAAVRPPSAPSAPLPARPRVLHCHDMAGGYNPKADEQYLACFSGWEEIDVFVYFAHNRVSMPPAAWVAACHARGVPCLATLITEADDGENAALLAAPEAAVEALCALCEHHGFDGYLVNLEAPVRGGVAPLCELLELLTICLKQRCGEQALCLCYDSLDEQGSVRYQNGLSPANASLFAACDGLFTNYWWGGAQLGLSARLAGPSAPGAADRRHDVYCGVDVFARNCSYAEGAAGCAAPCRVARDAGLSLALFAPGWSLERGPARGKRGDEAARADRRFWEDLGLRRLYRPE